MVYFVIQKVYFSFFAYWCFFLNFFENFKPEYSYVDSPVVNILSHLCALSRSFTHTHTLYFVLCQLTWNRVSQNSLPCVFPSWGGQKINWLTIRKEQPSFLLCAWSKASGSPGLARGCPWAVNLPYYWFGATPGHMSSLVPARSPPSAALQ